MRRELFYQDDRSNKFRSIELVGTEYRDLDRQVFLQLDSRITFIRLSCWPAAEGRG